VPYRRDVAQCQYVVTPLAQSFAVRGGVGSLGVLAASNCAWTAASGTPWINITSANSGSGLGRVNYSVVANPNANQRTGVITVAGLNVVVTQAGTGSANCAVTSISAGQPVNGSLAPGDCQSPLRIRDGARPFADRYSFTASSGQPVIISLTSAGFDTYLYLLDANGTVIAQNDDATPSGNSRIPAGSGFFTLPASGAFTIEVTSFSNNGLGNYALSLTTPAGGCTYAITPSGQSFQPSGGTGTVNVNTQTGCAWTAMSNNSWITVSSGSSGTGSGTVGYSVASNSAAARTGTITIAGLKVTITQSGTNGTACPTIAGVAPSTGAPGGSVTITGTNFTGVTAVKFAGNVSAQFNVISDTQITTVIPNGATNGPLAISKPTCPDAQTPGLTINRAVASVSAASYLGASLASESIVAAFGTGLATGVGIANSLPLPTALLGTTVKVKDSAGAERLASLFFVAPTQINFQIPPGTATGTANVTITGGDGTVSGGNVAITNVAPGLFTADASGWDLRQPSPSASRPMARKASNRLLSSIRPRAASSPCRLIWDRKAIKSSCSCSEPAYASAAR
ncbi:MAG: pre-peptidase C-terminal domain-containing protein, partial [Acidobacteriota bacterium]|nr:pre-peptidase C-terminal domain-containing protein [Acidobacteriota bacterium]